MELNLMNDIYGIDLSDFRPLWGSLLFKLLAIARCTMLLIGAPSVLI